MTETIDKKRRRLLIAAATVVGGAGAIATLVPFIESWNPQCQGTLGGYFCPCHGSRFDLAGRVFKGVPAPTNLVIPPYRFVSSTKVTIGEDAARG